MILNTSIYIHIPFCKSKCAYCDFFSIACGEQNVPDEYISSLCNEIKIRKAEKKIDALETVYIGGGTPSLLNASQLSTVMKEVFSGLKNKPKEITVEANPDDISKELLEYFYSCGITRISCGIQTFNGSALKNVRRRGNEKIILDALFLVKKYWKGVFSADLISGLPQEDEKSFLRTLEDLLNFRPEHVSMYSLTIEEDTPLGKSLLNGDFDYDYDKADEIWILGRDFLMKNGYGHYEVSNFCLPGFECKHNLVYWNQNDYIGCGAGGTGTFYGKNGFRFTNDTDIKKYISFWKNAVSSEGAPGTEEKLSAETQIFEFFMMGLRTLSGVSREEFKKRFGSDFPEKFIAVFERWAAHGFCGVKEISGEHFYSMNEKGILFLNRFLEEIL